MQIPVAEIWLPIPGYPGYEASSFGNIRSFRSPNGRGGLVATPRPVKPTLMKDKPYFQISLGKGHQVRLHIAILKAFKGPRPSPSHDGCHADGNPNNNAESNLYWGTKKQNMADQVKHGTRVMGSKSGNTHLTETDVFNIRQALNNGVAGIELARLYQVGTTTISRIKNRESWGHI